MSRVFVFGSNLKGIHGKGSALVARQNFGAMLGIGEGPMGGDPPRCYALPTKIGPYERMPYATVALHVEKFIQYAHEHPELEFDIVRVGCGLAGFSEDDISPLFIGAPANCHLPDGWRDYLDE